MGIEEKKDVEMEPVEETINTGPQGDEEEKKEAKKKCSHGPREKCLNCLGVTKENHQEVAGKCLHGPDAHCVNCMGVTSETFQNVGYTCNHPPGQRCANCAANDIKIKDARHLSFEHFVEDIKMKCKRKHTSDQKCQDCMQITNISYKVKEKCSGAHRPYPEQMCNKCIPQSIILKRQSYRHIDYVSV